MIMQMQIQEQLYPYFQAFTAFVSKYKIAKTWERGKPCRYLALASYPGLISSFRMREERVCGGLASGMRHIHFTQNSWLHVFHHSSHAFWCEKNGGM